MEQLEHIIAYEFQDKQLLKTALTHSSYANEKGAGTKYNERLEFLGDSVLGIITAEYLFTNHNDFPEGELTKVRSALVCEKALYRFACEISLGEYLYLGKGELHTGGRSRPSILADAFEALIAAIYLDGGMEAAKTFVLRFIKEAQAEAIEINTDYKTKLQEIIQKNPEERIEYVTLGEKGPDHDKRFIVAVKLNSNIIGEGTGRSKKQAEQLAAKEALRLMGL
ncbi:MAG: ribonuclease III [Ruminococcaceae bacterium]|nr:ribonuclease III [Oscillospiraceae bacterium]